MTINKAQIEAYIKTKKDINTICSKNTELAYRSILSSWLKYSDGDIDKAYDYFSGVMIKKYDSKSVKRRLYILSNFYKYLGFEDNIFCKLSKDYNISKSEISKKKVIRDSKVFTDKDISKIISCVSNKIDNTYISYRNYFLIKLLSEFGPRLGGLLEVRLSDIDFSKNKIMILASKNKVPYPLPIKHIREELLFFMNLRKKFLYDKAIETEFLFISNSENKLSDTAARRMINNICKEIGIYSSQQSTHQLRHWRATKYYREGMPIDLISELMGMSPKVLKTTYLHLTSDDFVKRFEDWRESSKNICPNCGYNFNNEIQYKKTNCKGE